jgi:hypothetical protein
VASRTPAIGKVDIRLLQSTGLALLVPFFYSACTVAQWRSMLMIVVQNFDARTTQQYSKLFCP